VKTNNKLTGFYIVKTNYGMALWQFGDWNHERDVIAAIQPVGGSGNWRAKRHETHHFHIERFNAHPPAITREARGSRHS
jgi:hypothetical protein